MTVHYIDFIAGSIGGAAGVLAGHPLDTVKVRLQTQQPGSQIYRGTWHCFSTIVKKEGFRGLYKGLSSPLASLSAINAIVFGVHGSACREFSNPDSLEAHFVAGCAAGMTQSVIASPTERVKLLLQLQNDSKTFRGPLHVTKMLVRERGVSALSRGFLATVARDAPAFGIYFASYEWMARKMSCDGSMESLTSMQLLLAGGGAGMLSWLFNYPADIIKSRFQANENYKSYWDCIKKTYAERGLRSFTVGLNSALIRAFPSNAATFFTVEWTYRILLDFNVLGLKADHLTVGATKAHGYPGFHCHHCHKTKKRSKQLIMPIDTWTTNCLLMLPEAGSTHIDPMIHGCRFL